MTVTSAQNQLLPGQKSLGIWLIVTGLIGWLSSFQLMLDKLKYLADPEAALSCNIGLTVQCGPNLNSAQGELFGFPNPLVGVAAFVIPVLIGILLVWNVRVPRLVMIGLNVGVLLGLVWVIWFIVQSIYVLGSLCPWCMTMWVAVIFMFWNLISASLAGGIFGESKKIKEFGTEFYSWAWVISTLSLLLVAVLAHLRLDLISNF